MSTALNLIFSRIICFLILGTDFAVIILLGISCSFSGREGRLKNGLLS
jgi:hypothetical protein